jgi:repressor LexA
MGGRDADRPSLLLRREERVMASPVVPVVDLEQIFSSRAGVFVLKMRGDSMVEDHLCEGDFVVIERRDTAPDGAQAVVLLDTGEATLKRYYREGSKVRLQPANSKLPARYVEASTCKVQGVVIGVIRSYPAHLRA